MILGMPVACLIEHINATALIDGVSHIVNAEEPKKEFDKLKELMEGRIEPTLSLRYQKAT